ncbi:MAG: DUF669 domain-containing protein [Candidatus Neomarinimicrobiota bacterium]
MATDGRELAWDDTIEREGGDFILLPAGDYEFTVETFERARHAGSEKLPPCNKAVVTLIINAPEGKVKLENNLFLHTTTEGLLSAFFGSIGQKKHGERLQMNWSKVPGSTGKCKVGIRNWTGKDGVERQSNEILRFYPREEQQGPKGYTAGRF